MLGRITLAATLVAGALVASATAPGWAAKPDQGEMKLTPESKEVMDLGTPHRSRLTPQQQDQLDREADVRQQQQIAEWSKLLGGEQAQLPPTPGGGVGNPHEQQAQTPAGPR